MSLVLAFPILIGLLMFQIGVINNMPLLHGYSDLVLLAIIAWSLQKKVTTAWQWSLFGGLITTLISAMPLGVYMISYMLVTGIALLMKKIVWRIPFISMLLVTVVGTFIVLGISYIVLRLGNVPLPLGYSMNEIIIPSAILNVILALPIYALISEIAKWLYPEVMEV
ncbi:MAG: rod shape-determining protein MreD [Anaerolineales bacterium]